MPRTSEILDSSSYPLISLEKTEDGLYVYPRTHYGILPYYRTPEGHIVWGLV